MTGAVAVNGTEAPEAAMPGGTRGGFSRYKERLRRLFFTERIPAALAGVSLTEAKYVVVDTELTGLNPETDSIISIGAVRMHGGRIDLGDLFYRVVNPATALSPESIVVHGITPSEVHGKPSIEAIFDDFAGFCGDAVIVGHFIGLDLDFIGRELGRSGRSPFWGFAVDTCRVYQWLQKNNGGFSRSYAGGDEDLDLFSIARRLRVPVSGAHNALNDAFITAQVFQRFVSLLPRLGVRTLGDLLIIGRS